MLGEGRVGIVNEARQNEPELGASSYWRLKNDNINDDEAWWSRRQRSLNALGNKVQETAGILIRPHCGDFSPSPMFYSLCSLSRSLLHPILG